MLLGTLSEITTEVSGVAAETVESLKGGGSVKVSFSSTSLYRARYTLQEPSTVTVEQF